MSVHRCDPTIGCGNFHVCEFVKTLSLQNNLQPIRAADYEIGYVVMSLSIMGIWHTQPKASVLYKRLNIRVRIDKVRRLLFPFRGIRNNRVNVTFDNGHGMPPRGEIDISRRAWWSMAFEFRQLMACAISHLHRLGQPLEHQSVVW